MEPSEKQSNYVNRIVSGLGLTQVSEYIMHFYPDADMDNLTKDQAQKIITGMSHRIAKPIFGVAGRDVSWR